MYDTAERGKIFKECNTGLFYNKNKSFLLFLNIEVGQKNELFIFFRVMTLVVMVYIAKKIIFYFFRDTFIGHWVLKSISALSVSTLFGQNVTFTCREWFGKKRVWLEARREEKKKQKQTKKLIGTKKREKDFYLCEFHLWIFIIRFTTHILS